MFKDYPTSEEIEMTERRGLAMSVLIFASFMDLLDATIVNVALPSIRTDLHATAPSSSGWSADTCSHSPY